MKYLGVALALMPVISFISYWAGYNAGEKLGKEKGWNSGYLMGKKVSEMISRG